MSERLSTMAFWLPGMALIKVGGGEPYRALHRDALGTLIDWTESRERRVNANQRRGVARGTKVR